MTGPQLSGPTVAAGAGRVRVPPSQLHLQVPAPTISVTAAAGSLSSSGDSAPPTPAAPKTATPTLPPRVLTGAVAASAAVAGLAVRSSIDVAGAAVDAAGVSLSDIDEWTSVLDQPALAEDVFVEALRKLFNALNKAEDLFVQRADALAHVMCVQMRALFAPQQPRSVRMCKYIINMMLGMCRTHASGADLARMFPAAEPFEALRTADCRPCRGSGAEQGHERVMIKLLTTGAHRCACAAAQLLSTPWPTCLPVDARIYRADPGCLMKLRSGLDKAAHALTWQPWWARAACLVTHEQADATPTTLCPCAR